MRRTDFKLFLFQRLFVPTLTLFFCSGLFGQSATTTGSFEIGADVFQNIPDQGTVNFSYTTSEYIPPDAYVTKVQYRIRIDNNPDPANFKCSDYEIFITSASNELRFLKVWDNLGGSTDEGNDDDVPDDADIFLDYRGTSAFYGETPEQAFRFVIDDKAINGEGRVHYVWFKVFWAAPNPNLDFATPPGWDDPIVVSSVTGTHTNSGELVADEPAYIDLSYVNTGALIEHVEFTNALRIDGIDVNYRIYTNVDSGLFVNINDYEHTFTKGDHEVCYVLDVHDSIVETDENNTYCKTFHFKGTPDPPALTSPSNNADCQPDLVTLDWEASPEATHYKVQVDDDSDFGTPLLVVSGISGTEFGAGDLSLNTTYYWRVKGTNNIGEGDYSSARHFTTSPPPLPSPVLVSPADNSTDMPATISFKWQTVAGATSYHFQADNNISFSSLLFDSPDWGNSPCTRGGIPEGDTYYWRVRANGSCASGPWSDTWKFEVPSAAPSAVSGFEVNENYMGQNSPNPFTKSTTIEFSISEPGNVSFEFIDLQGKVAATFTGYYIAGTHSKEIIVDNRLLPGIYICRMKADDFIDTKLCVIR